jgi:hypothetical protein
MIAAPLWPGGDSAPPQAANMPDAPRVTARSEAVRIAP